MKMRPTKEKGTNFLLQTPLKESRFILKPTYTLLGNKSRSITSRQISITSGVPRLQVA